MTPNIAMLLAVLGEDFSLPTKKKSVKKQAPIYVQEKSIHVANIKRARKQAKRLAERGTKC